MPDATLNASYQALYYPSSAEKIGQFSLPAVRMPYRALGSLTCCVDLCSGLPFSQSDKPDSIMDRFSR